MSVPVLKNQLVSTVIDKVLDGMTLKSALLEHDMTPQRFNLLLQGDREAAAAYSRATEIRADLLVDEIISIADSDADPAKVRNQVDARKWIASKLHAKRYGDRIDVNVVQTLEIGSTLAEARARLLPGRDQLPVIEAQVVDSQGISARGAHDPESLAPTESPPSPPVPDIFS